MLKRNNAMNNHSTRRENPADLTTMQRMDALVENISQETEAANKARMALIRKLSDSALADALKSLRP